jgi:hypothetical protein
LFDFAVDETVIYDYAQYFDTHHFSEAVCSRMAKEMAAEPAGVDADTVMANTARLRALSRVPTPH